MLKSLPVRLRAAAFALLAVAFHACTPHRDEIPTPDASPALTVHDAQSWYQSTYPTTAPLNGPQPSTASAAANGSGSDAPVLVWAHALTLGQGNQRLVLVPMAGDRALFAGRRWQGTRYLIVTRNAAQALNGNVVELLLRRTSAPVDTLDLFSNLYRGFMSGQPAAPAQGEGLVMLYSADYRYVTGRKFRNGQLLPSAPRLVFRPYHGNSGNKSQGTAQGTPAQSRATSGGACTDWYDGSTGAYITTTGDCGLYVDNGSYDPNLIDYGNGGTPADILSGPSGYGGGSGGGGGGGGYTSVPGMPATMPKQTGTGTCVPASLAQVKLSLCGGTQTLGQIEGAMDLYGIQSFNDPNFISNGVPLSGIGGFIDHFFNTTILVPAGNIQGAINAGHPVMIDVFSYMDGPATSVYHSVVVTGYNPNNPSQIYYLDPGTGTTVTGDANSMFTNSHYAIPITGCK